MEPAVLALSVLSTIVSVAAAPVPMLAMAPPVEPARLPLSVLFTMVSDAAIVALWL